jgi:hypothetical protein
MGDLGEIPESLQYSGRGYGPGKDGGRTVDQGQSAFQAGEQPPGSGISLVA